MQKCKSLDTDNSYILVNENVFAYNKLLEIRKLYEITQIKINKYISNINNKLINFIFLQNLEDKLESEKLNIQYTIIMNNNLIKIMKKFNL
jgi:hypothetical protein